MKIILLGKAGSGKTTMARLLVQGTGIPQLSLDEIAWRHGLERVPHDECVLELKRFIDSNEQWVIEGCYGDLIEVALPYCSELRFLNPGVDECVQHCLQRPWEPDKYSSPEEQQQMLANLIDWVRGYETREDEYGLKCHRRIFDAFEGQKREYLNPKFYFSAKNDEVKGDEK